MVEGKILGKVQVSFTSACRSVEEFVNQIEGLIIDEDHSEAIYNTWSAPSEWPFAMKYPNTIEVFFELMWPELIKTLKAELS